MVIGPKTKCLHFSLTGYDLRFAKMGVKKKIEELSIVVLIEMRDVHTYVEFDLEDFFILATGTFWPWKKNDDDSPGFYNKISGRCERMRQRWSRCGDIPPDLSAMIKDMIKSYQYHLIFFY